MNELDVTRFKTCTCGATVEDENVEVKNSYTWLGWFWWTMGTTAIPRDITFRCKKCNYTFECITDRELIKYYIFYKRY